MPAKREQLESQRALNQAQLEDARIDLDTSYEIADLGLSFGINVFRDRDGLASDDLAVAQLLAYVFQLRAYREAGGDIPQPPDEFPVPGAYRHD